MSDLVESFGRLHPLILHLPIGFLVALGLFELLFVRGRVVITRDSITVLAWLTAIAAAVSALAGWVLAHEPSYTGEVVELHESLGIGVAIASVVAALAHGVEPSRNRLALYRLALVVALALLFPAGHLGSTITHGEDWLAGPRDADGSADPPVGSASTYASSIAPIFAASCSACHGEAKQKSGLRLDQPERILAGGENGPVLVPGDPAQSELVRRLRLPLDHEDHMPPESKPQPSAAEVARIEAWIAAGAPFEGVVDLGPASAGSETGTGTADGR
jgi:uncharacterized membrane protein